MQTQFMGLRPEGWREEIAAKKARHRRKQRIRLALGVLALVAVIAAISMSDVFAAGESAVTEPVIVEVTTLHSLFAEAAATGLPGSSVPLAMRDRSGCEWLLSASLDPFTQRFVGRAEAKQCGAIKQPVSGYLVGMDDLTGLQAECHDQWRNEIGSTMCLAAGLPNGTPGRIVVQAN
ncbi:hypothetical protein [Pseudomonas aeruginosa]|uniref:hypothetical protein n=1 Tax=Pseudomonas aeruginosa TaxID=287 RepID=UPI003D2BFF4B